MQTTAEQLLRAFQRQERQFVEQRFPLEFAAEVPALRELYSQAKAFRWNPATDIAWDRFDASAYPADTRDAARLTWSRRAWGTYPGLAESTALLIRLCLESGARQMDAKLFLSFRPAEEAKHLEACVTLADRLGGYVPDPGDDATRRAMNHPFAQMALDREIPAEAIIAALGCLDDQLDLNLHRNHLQHATDETARTVLRLIAGDKQRHVVFAWTWLGGRVDALDAAGRTVVRDAVSEMLEHVVLRGYRTAWLLPESPVRARLLEAEACTAAAGLGASTIVEEQSVVRATVAQVRERLAVWRIDVPAASHPGLGVV